MSDSDTIITVDRLSKKYLLGQIGATSLRESAERLWRRIRYRGNGVTEFRGNGVEGDRGGRECKAQVAGMEKEGTPLDSDTPIRQYADTSHIWALKDVSFEVKRGEVLGIIGRNGAGKSTLLKILSRITEPTSGRAVLRGRVASLLEVGTGFHPELTGRENIFLNGAILGMKKAEVKAKFDEIVAFAEVEKFIDTPVKRYSSGMYVRLAFAVAAHLEPEILLVDEVLAVGDASFQKKCLGKMEDVAAHGRTILFVSHNMVAVNSLCTRSVWLDCGELVEHSDTLTVVQKYLQEQSPEANDCVAWNEDGKAPGNEKARLKKVLVEPKDGAGGKITMDSGFSIEVEFIRTVEDVPFHVTLHVLNADQTIVFTTGSAATRMIDQSGRYRTICHVPGQFLNSGRYSVDVCFVENQGIHVFDKKSAISFTVHDFSRRDGGYMGREPGIVVPKLRWEVVCLSRELRR